MPMMPARRFPAARLSLFVAAVALILPVALAALAAPLAIIAPDALAQGAGGAVQTPPEKAPATGQGKAAPPAGEKKPAGKAQGSDKFQGKKERTLGGIPGVEVDMGKERVVLAQKGDTLFAVELNRPTEAAIAAFEALVASVKFRK